jgi:glycosyltransferase involved in cell wall biosynthesis
VVNSAWSNQALLEVGVEADKVKIIPLAYDPPTEAQGFNRTYPLAFTPARPLRVLFLGQVNLRKGILPLLQAIDTLAGKPLELWVVGPLQVDIPKKWLVHPQIKWMATVPRSAVTYYYRQADVFILPTYSDGFAITQLEACAWQLPLIVSANCGKVAINGTNGIVLPDLEPNSIARALLSCLANAAMLVSMAKQTSSTYSYSLDQLCERLELCLL